MMDTRPFLRLSQRAPIVARTLLNLFDQVPYVPFIREELSEKIVLAHDGQDHNLFLPV